MRGKLGIESVWCRQHAPGTIQVAQVGGDLACPDRVIGQTQFLGVFDLGIPVGTLDQAGREMPAGILGQRDQPVDQRGSALLISLYDQAESLPTG